MNATQSKQQLHQQCHNPNAVLSVWTRRITPREKSIQDCQGAQPQCQQRAQSGKVAHASAEALSAAQSRSAEHTLPSGGAGSACRSDAKQRRLSSTYRHADRFELRCMPSLSLRAGVPHGMASDFFTVDGDDTKTCNVGLRLSPCVNAEQVTEASQQRWVTGAPAVLH
jgi:hypothetical protein